ncbi:MAG: Transcriptional repressor NrdR [Chloroflexi bacterium ADurb.Bin325]|nr:MAG: Transcriptional repressor NrdR [Chloroflexi bacterium ADurb.Bin325]
MQCPYCGQADSRVVDTRATGDGIRRRRECQACRKRFTTYEQISEALLIVKRDGRREPFDRHKLLQGVRIACAKRPIAMTEIERIVSQIEEHLFGLGRAEVSSNAIGQLVLEKLKELDSLAYIRFAIVYMAMEDVETLQQEIQRLLAEPK